MGTQRSINKQFMFSLFYTNTQIHVDSINLQLYEQNLILTAWSNKRDFTVLLVYSERTIFSSVFIDTCLFSLFVIQNLLRQILTLEKVGKRECIPNKFGFRR